MHYTEMTSLCMLVLIIDTEFLQLMTVSAARFDRKPQGLVWWWLYKLRVTRLVLSWTKPNQSNPVLLVPWRWSSTFCQLRLWVFLSLIWTGVRALWFHFSWESQCDSLPKINTLRNMKNLSTLTQQALNLEIGDKTCPTHNSHTFLLLLQGST